MARTKGKGSKPATRKPSSKGTKGKRGKRGGVTITKFTPLKMGGKAGPCEFPQGPALTREDAVNREYTKYARQMYAVMARFRNLDRCLWLKYGGNYTGNDLNRAEAETLAELRLKAKDIEHQYAQACAKKNFQFGWNLKTDANRQSLVARDKLEFEDLASRYGVNAMTNKLAEIDGDRFDPRVWDCSGPAAFGDSTFADMPFDEGFSGDYGDSYGDEGFYGDVY